MSIVIEAKNLVKDFSTQRALQHLNLNIKKGECFGLLGPNGAGKSTFIGMIYGMVKRSQGDLRVFGMDPDKDGRAIKKRLGVVTQDNALDENLSVLENMLIYASFLGIPKKEKKKKACELLDYMNLLHKADAPIQSLSGGMKRRLVFVRALLGDPELLILDEPTTGLDPAVRHLLWGKVKELHKRGVTIILTTHYIHEAEVLCDRLAIMDKGEVITEGDPQALIKKYSPGYVGSFSLEQKQKVEEVLNSHKEISFDQDNSTFYLRTNQLSQLTSFVETQQLKPLQMRPSNLEDVFLALTGQELSQDD